MGWVPRSGDLDLSGMDTPAEVVDEATDIDLAEWRAELELHGDFFASLGEAAPPALALQRGLLLARLAKPMS